MFSKISVFNLFLVKILMFLVNIISEDLFKVIGGSGEYEKGSGKNFHDKKLIIKHMIKIQWLP